MIGDDAVVATGFVDQALGEHVGVGRGVGWRLGLRAGDDVELADAVILVGAGFGGFVALALFGDDVDEDRAALGVADVVEDVDQVVDIVAVDGADVEEAEFLEQRSTGEEGAGEFLGLARGLVDDARHLLGDGFGAVAHAAIERTGDELGEIGAHGAGGRRDRHVVVVEDDDEPRIHGAGVVHRLVGHAGRHGAVADDGDDVARFALELRRDGHAEAGRDRGRGMAGAERVVLALGAAGEAAEPMLLAQGADAVAATGQHLVRIGLVADVPDQTIVRGVEDGVERDGQFDDAEAGAEVTAGDRDGVDHFGAQLIGELAELRPIERLAGRRAS